jgi:hypothetical protein
VRYIATLLGSTDEATMRYFILVALLLDPAAVLLLLAATQRSTFVAGHLGVRTQQANKQSGKHLM